MFLVTPEKYKLPFEVIAKPSVCAGLSKNNIEMINDEVLSIGMGINMLIKENVYHLCTNKKLIDKIKNYNHS